MEEGPTVVKCPICGAVAESVRNEAAHADVIHCERCHRAIVRIIGKEPVYVINPLWWTQRVEVDRANPGTSHDQDA